MNRMIAFVIGGIIATACLAIIVFTFLSFSEDDNVMAMEEKSGLHRSVGSVYRSCRTSRYRGYDAKQVCFVEAKAFHEAIGYRSDEIQPVMYDLAQAIQLRALK